MPGMVDLSADIGESFGSWRMGRDEEILDSLTSANVACGFHAGDPRVMQQSVAACLARGRSEPRSRNRWACGGY